MTGIYLLTKLLVKVLGSETILNCIRTWYLSLKKIRFNGILPRSIRDSKTGKAVFKFLYDGDLESWIEFN